MSLLTWALFWRPTTVRDVSIRGADISFTLQEEAIGQHVQQNGETKPIEKVLADHGANYVRLRVWVDPEPGTSDLDSALTMARRAHSADLKLLLNLHYSDTWADPGAQETPAAWQGQDLNTLVRSVESYTREVVAAFAQQGTPVDIIQIGNEVSNGMLWPMGRVGGWSGATAANWPGLAELLEAGARGARQGGSPDPPAVMIHVDAGGDADSAVRFYDRLRRQGVEFDIIGLSYYPFWNGSLADLEETLRTLAQRYRKDIVIAETAYPWTLANEGPSVVEKAEELPDIGEFPPTPQGQAAYYTALNRLLKEVPHGHGTGYFVWEPGWLPGVPATSEVGTTHGNLTLFDWSGNGLPALETFRPTGASEN